MNNEQSTATRAGSIRLATFLTRLIWLSVLPLLLLSAWLAFDNVMSKREELDLDATNRVKSFTTAVDQHLNARMGALNVLANSPLLDHPESRQAFYQEAQGFLQSFGSHVILADLDLQMLLNTRRPLDGSPLPKLPRATGRAAAPVALETGKPAFLLLTTFETRQFQAHLDELMLPPGWALSIRDSTGAIIAHSGSAASGPESSTTAPVRYVVNSALAPWSVVLEIPHAVHQAPIIQSALALLAAVLGATLLSFLGGTLGSRRLAKAMASLTSAATTEKPTTHISEITEVRHLLNQAAEQREIAEASRAESEERFRRLFQMAPLPMGFIANDGTVIALNSRFDKVFGYTKAEIPTISEWWSLAYPEPAYRAQVLSSWGAAMDQSAGQEGAIDSGEYRVTCRDASQRTVLVSGIVLEDGILAAFYDITERKQAEDALAQSGTALKEAQSLAKMGIWTWDFKTDRPVWSEEIFHIFGCDPALPALNFKEIPRYFSNDNWAQLSNAVENTISEGTPYALDLEVLRPDGSRCWALFRGKASIDGEGTVISLQGMMQDITERKQAEATLRQTQATAIEEQRRARLAALNMMEDAVAARKRIEIANAKLRASEEFKHGILESIAATIAVLDRNGVIIAVNENWRRFALNNSQTAGIPAPHTDVGNNYLAACQETEGLGAEEAPAVIAGITAVLEEHLSSFSLEYPCHTASEQRWFSMTVTPLGNEVRGVVIAHQEITTRRLVEEQLRKLSLALEQSPGSIVITNLEGNLEYVNDAFVRTTGFSREEAIGQNPRILQSGRTPAESYRDLWQALTQGRPWRGEFYNRRKDGSEYVEFAIVAPIRQADGRITHYVAVKEDITEKKRLGLELDQHRHHLEALVDSRTTELTAARQAADVANHAKSAFLANMSHEIRTPLNAIIGLTYVMQRSPMSPEQIRHLRKIDSAGQHLLSVINDILDFSKIEAGRLNLENTNFQLSKLLEQVGSLISESAQAKALRVDISGDHVPEWLNGDPTRLRQALLNFAGNAVKFTERGFIALRAILQEDDGDEFLVRFEVEDSGIGIPPEHRRRLFQAFEQADASTTRKYGGTGLGLAITARLAHLMGGEAGVDSKPGQGSTFWLTARLRRGQGLMPLAEMDAVETAEALLRRKHAGQRLLVAEDNLINQEVVTEVLTGVGLSVDIARNGRIAVDMAKDGNYDLILMDMQMPEMDGLEATRALRSQPEWATKPILAMTANAFTEDREACLAAGMNDFVAKPVDPPSLFTSLSKWLPEAPARTHIQTQPAATSLPPAGSDDLYASLAAIEDLEVDTGLNNLRGNLQRYIQLIRQFNELHRDDMQKLEAIPADSEPGAKILIAHSLRGAAGALGATRIQLLATDLETALRSSRPAEEIAAIVEAAKAAASSFDLAVQNIAAEEISPVSANPAQAREVIAALDPLLATGNIEATWTFHKHIGLLRATLPSATMTRLEEKMGLFDFDEVLKILREAQAELAGK